MPVSRLTAAFAAGSVLGCAFASPALAQTAAGPNAAAPNAGTPNAGTPNAGGPGGGATPGTPPANANPVVASVNGKPIRLSDVRLAAGSLPEDMRSVPPQMLFPLLVNQLIDQEALADQARAEGLQNDPKVQEAMARAADTVLQNALLTREVSPAITDAKLHAAYDAQYADKKGDEEVHARHILVKTEAAANDVIRQLKHGADFATLAKKVSTDKSTAADSGGDLGWFKKGDMVPAFSAAAFSMKPGQFTTTPVHTPYGWHVIQVLGTRTAPPPSFDSVKDQLRQSLIQQGVRNAVKSALVGVKVVRYNPDGTPAKAPPPAPPSASGGATTLPAPAPPGPGTTPPTSE